MSLDKKSEVLYEASVKPNKVLCEGSSMKDAIRKEHYQPRRPSYFISKTPEQEALEMDKSKRQRQTRIMSIQECYQFLNLYCISYQYKLCCNEFEY